MPKRGTAKLARQLGARVRSLRQEIDLTQETLAWECDLAKPYLSQIESGKRLPSLGALFALADRLGVDVTDLLIFDTSTPRGQLLEGVRLKDAKAVRSALTLLKLS
jgi:transcriptional regulator with XRE-family HTH domain